MKQKHLNNGPISWIYITENKLKKKKKTMNLPYYKIFSMITEHGWSKNKSRSVDAIFSDFLFSECYFNWFIM